MPSTTAVEHRFEMGITRAEFLRLLPLAVGANPRPEDRAERETYCGERSGVEWRIALLERAPRRIALLSLPVLEVTLTMRASMPTLTQTFVERFLATYQRAGG